MKKLDGIEKIRSILVELLQEIKDICEENGLRYYLAYGTLLGAVRHKGFIPWDDDLDVEMPRPDYEKFITIYHAKERENILYDPENNPDYLYTFAKLVKKGTYVEERGCHGGVKMGLYVDIFPIDGLGDNMSDAIALQKSMKMPSNLLMSYRMDFYRPFVSLKRNLLVAAAKCVAPLYGKKRLKKIVEKRTERYDFEKSAYIGILVSTLTERSIYKKELYLGEKMELEFEKGLFSVPTHYHEVLTQQYDDYMQLPPEGKRVFTHGYDAYIED